MLKLLFCVTLFLSMGAVPGHETSIPHFVLCVKINFRMGKETGSQKECSHPSKFSFSVSFSIFLFQVLVSFWTWEL